MCRAEDAKRHQGRQAGIQAARDVFYKGPIAARRVTFIAETPVEDASGTAHTGLLSYDDMAAWGATVEEPDPQPTPLQPSPLQGLPDE